MQRSPTCSAKAEVSSSKYLNVHCEWVRGSEVISIAKLVKNVCRVRFQDNIVQSLLHRSEYTPFFVYLFHSCCFFSHCFQFYWRDFQVKYCKIWHWSVKSGYRHFPEHYAWFYTYTAHIYFPCFISMCSGMCLCFIALSTYVWRFFMSFTSVTMATDGVIARVQ